MAPCKTQKAQEQQLWHDSLKHEYSARLLDTLLPESALKWSSRCAVSACGLACVRLVQGFFYSKGFRGASAKMLKGAVPLLAWVLVPVLSTIFSLTVRD